jgi:hypothetical protein
MRALSRKRRNLKPGGIIMGRILVISFACVMLVASGLVHGVWTDRWSDQEDLVSAARDLERLPMTIGAWQGSPIEMEKNPNAGAAGMMARRYVQESTGKVVTLLLACGRSGAICTHTPDVCYSASGYDVEAPKRFQLPSRTAEAPAEFWTARFVKESPGGASHLRIFWAWHHAGAWKIADHPRLAFAGEKVLYKMYLIHEMLQPDEPIEGDACVEFMRDIVPMLRDSVFASKQEAIDAK